MIEIIVSGGVVQRIDGIPPGARVVVYDYDVSDFDRANPLDGFKQDDSGDWYEELVFGRADMPTLSRASEIALQAWGTESAIEHSCILSWANAAREYGL